MVNFFVQEIFDYFFDIFYFIYEGRFNGWETYDAFAHITNTLMYSATLD